MSVMPIARQSARNTPPKKSRLVVFQVAALTVSLSGQDDIDLIQLLPAGQFRSTDGSGRPEDVPHWQMDAKIAAHVITQFEGRGQPCVIDYEHQTLSAEENGQPAPAAGWIHKIVWLEGKGLYAHVKWTARARQYIDAGEYLYISPVFPYDDEGRPLAILHAALTNNPALTGMDQVRLAAASALSGFTAFNAPGGAKPAEISGDHPMNEELLKLLRSLLGLSDTATEEEILAALPGFVEKLTADQEKLAELTGNENDPAKLSAAEELEALKEEVAALRAGKIDPTKYVPVAALTAMQKQINDLSAAHGNREVDEIVSGALKAGKLAPALEPWARDLGKKDIAALRAYVGASAPIAALTGQQTTTLKIGDGKTAELTSDELAVCRATGVDPGQYVKHRA